MKKLYFILTALMLMMGQYAKAQQIDINTGMVVWEGTTLAKALEDCAAGKYVYLCRFESSLGTSANPVKEKFMGSGGSYGVQGVLSSVGMRVQIVAGQTNGSYQIVTRVANANWSTGSADNIADRVGFDGNANGKNVYLDRKNAYASDQFVNWTFNSSQQTKSNIRYKDDASSHTVSVQTYTIQSAENHAGVNATSRYIVANGNNLVTGTSTNAIKWILVSEDDYKQAMDDVTWGEVDLGSFVKDADFSRDNKDARYWVWGNAETGTDVEGQPITLDNAVITGNNIHWHQRNQDLMCNGINLDNGISRAKIGSNVAGSGGNVDHDGFRNNYGQYYAAEIYREINSLSQEISMSGVENLTSGLYKLTAQALYYDDKTDNPGMTNDGVAYFVVKVKTGDDESTERLPIIPMNKVSGNNITPHSGVSAGYVFDRNANAYVLNFFVELTQSSKLTIGIETTKAEGWTVIGNIHLYAHGKQVVFCDEDWTTNETITVQEFGIDHDTEGDPYQIIGFYNNDYSYPVTVNYQRTFTLNKWNTICLPIPVAGAQIRQAFGNDCIISEFDGIYGSVMKFKSVDLDTEGLEAGKPYIIKPTREPDVAKGETDEVTISNGGKNQVVQVTGPTYYIPGVDNSSFTYDQGNPQLPELQKPTGVGDPTVTFEGTFYKKIIAKDSGESTSFDNWVISKGNMYHLQNTKDVTVYATYCYLHAPKAAHAKTMRIMVDDEEVMTTAIEGLYIDNGPAIEDNEVYNLNGQRVGGKEMLNALPKGVYIVNGRKYVVR